VGYITDATGEKRSNLQRVHGVLSCCAVVKLVPANGNTAVTNLCWSSGFRASENVNTWPGIGCKEKGLFDVFTTGMFDDFDVWLLILCAHCHFVCFR
jgi:hypothetical protein